MRLALKCLCDLKNSRKDGTAPIYIQYCHTIKSRTILNTKIAVPPAFFNKDKQEIIKQLPAIYGNAKELNEELNRLYRVAEELLRAAMKRKISDPILFLKENFKVTLTIDQVFGIGERVDRNNVRINKDFFFQFEDYIKAQSRKVSFDTIKLYRVVMRRLKHFENFRNKPIKFDELDFNFYEELVDYLTYEYKHFGDSLTMKGLKVNTVGTTIKQLRVFINNRILKKLIAPVNMKGWRIVEEDSDAVYCPWPEIYQIANTDLSGHRYLEPYRDDFVLGCFLGMRFSDFSGLEKSDLRDGFLYKKQQKSDHRVVIPLRDLAAKILENRFSKSFPKLTNAEFNRHIKTVAKLAKLDYEVKHSYKKGNRKIVEVKPKYEWITSHTCRRSFCTNEFLAGTPVELIMKISGHKSVKDFYKYIRISTEEAAEKIKQLWIERGEIKQEIPAEKSNEV